MTIPKRVRSLLCVAAVVGLTTAALAKTELLVYIVVKADELAGFKKAFETEHLSTTFT